MDVIKAVRNVKTETGCAPSKKVSLYIMTDSKRLITSNADSILKLAGASEIKFINSAEEAGEKTVTKVLSIGTIYIPMGELVDTEKERARLEGELEKVMAEIRRADGKLNNQGFMAKAPKKLVDEEKEKLNKYIEMREKILTNLKNL
jgi:valyl-tRNA synthetase